MATIDRAGLTADLADRYALLLAEAGIAATDATGGLKPVLDQVQTAADGNPELAATTLNTLARYLLLDRIVDRLGTRFDVSTGGDSYKLNQLYTNAKDMRTTLEKIIGWLALADVAAGAVTQLVTVTAPYLATDEGETAWF